MREIKFRGKRVDNGEWIYGFLVHDKKRRLWQIVHSLEHVDCAEFWAECWDVDPDTVGEFTGGVDYNGKDIFEGDIYKSRYIESTGVVRFGEYIPDDNDGCIVIGFYVGDCGIGNGIDESPWGIIIGNIHDNPELKEEG